MPAQRLSAQEYIQQLRAKRNEDRSAGQAQNTPPLEPSQPADPGPESTPSQPATPPPIAATAVPVIPQPSPVSPVTEAPSGTELVPAIAPAPVEKTVLEWKAPSRPYKKRDRRYYLTVGIIVFLISLILFFAGQFLPIAVVISVAFLAYALSAVPPGTSAIQVTNFGIRVDEELYDWLELGRFWFKEKYGQDVLHVELGRFPWRLTVLLNGQDRKDLAELLGVLLVQEEPKPTSYEKAATWLQKMIPLE